MTKPRKQSARKPATRRTPKNAPTPTRLSGLRAYSAAKIDRLTADWIMSPLSANEEIRGGLDVIRKRARELERDVDWVRRYLSMLEANIVGRGFALKVEGDGGERIQKLFTEWADRSDVCGRLSFADRQRLMIRTAGRDGEGLDRILRGSSYPHGMALQMLESDYIDHEKNATLSDGNRIVMGVEVDQRLSEVAYHMFASHPGDSIASVGQRVSRVSARDIIHVYRAERPGQVRSVSWMASSMQGLNMLRGYMEAELVASRTAACKMGFYKIPPGEDYGGDGKDASGAPISDATPGSFEQMPTGWEFQSFDPQHPTSQFPFFVKSILRQIAGGLNVAYNNFANDLDGVSYSSIRSGTIEEREQWIVYQDWFARSYLRPIYTAWLEMAALSGVISADDAETYKYADKWTGRRWPWVDPQSDIAAKKEEIALGLTSPSEIAREQARDYQAIQKQISDDNAKREENNLAPISAGTADAAVQDTALNGAQITSLVAVMTAAASGQLPVESVGPILKASFPSLDDKEIATITKPLKSFKPETTNGN